VNLTVKRAIILDQPGFMMKVALLGNNQEYYLGPRPKKRLLPLREVPAIKRFPPVIVKAF
jgi:hypothetical protein